VDISGTFRKNMSLEEASVIHKLFFEYIISHCVFIMHIWKYFGLSMLLTCLRP